MLRDSYKQAKKLLRENREIMDKLADYLIEKETITGKEFMKIYRKEKGIPEPENEDENSEIKKDHNIKMTEPDTEHTEQEPDNVPEEQTLQEQKQETLPEQEQAQVQEQQPEAESQLAQEEAVQQPQPENRGVFSGACDPDQNREV